MKNKIVLITASLLLASNVTVFASSVTNKENQIKENQETIQELQQDKLGLSNEKKKLNSELQNILNQFTSVSKEADALKVLIIQKEKEIKAAENSINELTARINVLEKEIETKIAEITAKEVELAEKKAILDARVRASYMNNSMGNVLFTLIESKSLIDFTDRLTLIQRMVEKDNEIIELVKTIMAELTVKKAELEANKKEFVDSKAVLETERAQLVAVKGQLDAENQVYQAKLADLRNLEASKENTINMLAQEERELASEIGDIIEENQDLENEIAALIRAEAAKNAAAAAKAKASSSSSSKPSASVSTGSQSSNGYIKPVSGRVSSPYGYRIHPVLGYKKFHTGMDFAASSGTSVRSVKSGTVILAKYNSSYGNYIIVDHGNGVSSLYAHLKGFNVGYGSRVSQGDTIGFVGSTGMSTGPHLHFEIRINGSHVNPAPYLGL
ncbi:MAG TPA: peptidoglycan DD-metalloendopeptidase family protein [Clostridiaceae bacterium]|nr:peptidoglycan DD-metalloendopeptidase family protein [Clostridiaceae bacterium]